MNNKKFFFDNYFDQVSKNICAVDQAKLLIVTNLISKLNKKNKIILVGNGGSASMASHVAVDLTKFLSKRAVNFNEPNLITCFGNDYGYENWVREALKAYAIKGDIVILISSSGESKNLINGAKYSKKKGFKLITLTGFDKNNSLSKLGDVNFWTDSKVYNIVEMTHHVWLLSLVDYLVKK